MHTKHSGFTFIYRPGNKIAGMLLFFLCSLFCARLYSQSYFYLVNQLPFSDSNIVTYHTFLSIDASGGATARIRYKEPVTNNDRFFELQLTDSLLPGENTDSRYLMCTDEPLPLDGTDGSGFAAPRFVFKKQTNGEGDFYFPSAVEYKTGNNKWVASVMEITQEKTYEDLAKEETFVSRFFNNSEAFYNYIFHPSLVSRDPNAPKRKEKLFLIAVVNTNDKTIGASSQKDLDNITSTFTTLAENLNMTMVLTSIAGSGFRKGAVDTAIQKLKPSAIDIVVFYFSGHGFRYSNDSSKYPRMSLRPNQDMDRGKNNLNVEEVYKKIIKKGAKVNIVFSDCCNEDIGEKAPPIGRGFLRTRGWGTGANQQKLNMENCTALFFPKKPLNILSSSTDVNQLAIGNPTLGGFFTCFFKTELDKSLYSYEPSNSWLRILLSAKEKARYQSLSALCGTSRCVQTATFRVEPAP